jgi:hypothetical protein
MLTSNAGTPVEAKPDYARARVAVSEDPVLAREASTWTPRPPEPRIAEPRPEPQTTPRTVRYNRD